jgi:hypothetical protein
LGWCQKEPTDKVKVYIKRKPIEVWKLKEHVIINIDDWDSLISRLSDKYGWQDDDPCRGCIDDCRECDY